MCKHGDERYDPILMTHTINALSFGRSQSSKPYAFLKSIERTNESKIVRKLDPITCVITVLRDARVVMKMKMCFRFMSLPNMSYFMQKGGAGFNKIHETGYELD